jgi:hypothetical protein
MSIELQHRPLGRPCVVCNMSDRPAIEAELASGAGSIRGIAGRFGVAPESLRRHVRAHLDPAIQEAMAALNGVPALDLLVRLLDLASDAHDFRIHLEETGNDRLVSQAFRAEAATIGYLADRLGVAKLPTHDLDRFMRESLTEAMGVLRVVVHMASDFPKVGDVLAERFDQHDLPDLASQIRKHADRGRTLILESNKETP